MTPARAGESRRLAIMAVLLALVGATPYLRAWNYGLVNFDDYAYLVAHSWLWEGSAAATLLHCLTEVGDAIWMPLTWLSYAADCAMFGDWAGGFHLHSICLHGINAALVGLFLRELFGDRCGWAVWLGTAVWALHPLRCESVVLLSSRKDVLSFLFELLALLCWVRGSKSPPAAERRLTLFALALFLLGVACKPSVMTFPLLCLTVDAFILRRLDIRRHAWPLALAAAVGMFVGWQQRVGGALSDGSGETIVMRLADSVAAFGIYLRNSAWPKDLALQCVKRWPDLPRFIVPGAVLSASFCAILIWRGLRFRANPARADGLLAGLLWFAVALFPMLGLVSFGYHAFADRFTYIPAVGLSIALVDLLVAAARRFPGARRTFCVAGMGLAVALGLAAWRQTGFWRDDFTVFSHTLEVDGDSNGLAHQSLGSWYFEFPHDLAKSVWHFERSISNDGIRHMGSCYLIYVFALCELKQIEKAGRAMADFERHLANGRAAGGANADHANTLYMYGKVAWWIADPETRELAEAYLAENVRADDPGPVWTYLRWQLAVQKGEEKQADAYRAELTKPHRMTDYIDFRYLRRRQ